MTGKKTNLKRDSLKIMMRQVMTAIMLVAVSIGVATGETLTLEQALDIAFAQSPTMQQAQFSLEASEHNLAANRASLKSQFSLTLQPYQYSKSRDFNDAAGLYTTREQSNPLGRLSIVQPIKWTDGTLTISEEFGYLDYFVERINYDPVNESYFLDPIREYTYSSYFSVNLHQPLFTYNRTMQAQRELELSLENAQLYYAIRKLDIESSVTQQFLGLYHSSESVKIAEEELANATASHEIIQSKVDAGISAMEELYQAELTLSNSRARLEDQRISSENALDNFRILLGLSLDSEIDVAADIRKKIVDVDLAIAINHGLANRMELRQKNIDIQNALYSLIRAGAQNEFEASVDLSYGYTGTGSDPGDVYSAPTKSPSVGITVNIPLFDWGEKNHTIAAEQARIESTRLSASEESRRVVLEIRQAFRNLQNQKSQIEIAEQNIRNARLTYELNLERYKNGDLSSKDMSYYQNQLSSEQLNEIQALINYQTALLDLKIKSLWDFEKNEPVVGQI